MSWEIRVFLSRQKSTTGHLSKQLGNHPAKPLVLHNTQWIFITSPTCFLPSSQLSLASYIPESKAKTYSLFFFFLLSQIMKKDVDINVTGVLWYIFNVWEKIETQGENKQACKDLCVWRIWYLQMRLSKSCKCFIVVFFYFFSGTMTANESCPGTNHHSSW